MQSGYGVSEMQQFMVDGICSQFFPLPPATTTATSADLTHKQQQEQQQVQQQPHPFLHHHHQQQQQQQFHHFHQYPNHPHHLHFQDHHPSPPPVPQQQIHHHQSPPRFPTHFHHPIPITQQLFQQNHQFHLFQQEQQRRLHHHHHQMQPLDPDPQPPENSASSPRIDVGRSNGAGGGISSFLRPSMNFRLSVNENSGDGGGDSRDGLNDDNGLLQGDEVDGSEERQWPPPPPQSSREEDDSATAIKEPFWRPLDLDLEYINRNNNKSFKEKRGRTHQEQQQQQQQEQEFLVLEGSTTKVLTKEPLRPPITNVNAEDGTNSGNNYKLFSELEAICKPGTNTIIIGNNSNNNNHQTGSSSALTGENPPTSLANPSPFGDQNADEVMDDHVERTSDTSTGEEASLKKATTTSNLNQRGIVCSSITKDKGKRSRRRKKKQEVRSIVAFLETLVKQLIDHQETLHRKFIEALEIRDQQSMATEQAWRQQEATKSMMESKAREEFQAIAATREAEIVSFLERITGESVNLPTKPPKLQMQREDNNNINVIDNNDNDENHQAAVMSSNRWPKAEVQALIKVRSGLETRFQEPGLKGPLWEEVSSGMAAIGYRRSAKRCKEKWENINKYFRKTKESSKRRPRQSKTCPYFHQLDQLYSKSTATTTSAMTTTNNDSNNSDKNLERRGNSELLDAIVVSKNDQSGGFNNYSDNDMVVVPLRRIEFDTSNCGDGLLEQEGNKDDEHDEGEGESLANSTLPAVKKGEPDEEDERMEESNPPII